MRPPLKLQRLFAVGFAFNADAKGRLHSRQTTVILNRGIAKQGFEDVISATRSQGFDPDVFCIQQFNNKSRITDYATQSGYQVIYSSNYRGRKKSAISIPCMVTPLRVVKRMCWLIVATSEFYVVSIHLPNNATEGDFQGLMGQLASDWLAF